CCARLVPASLLFSQLPDTRKYTILTHILLDIRVPPVPHKLVHKGPTLDTLHMVECVLRKFDEPLSLNRIKAVLPRKMMHAPLREAIEHYKRLGCVTAGSKG